MTIVPTRKPVDAVEIETTYELAPGVELTITGRARLNEGRHPLTGHPCPAIEDLKIDYRGTDISDVLANATSRTFEKLEQAAYDAAVDAEIGLVEEARGDRFDYED